MDDKKFNDESEKRMKRLAADDGDVLDPALIQKVNALSQANVRMLEQHAAVLSRVDAREASSNSELEQEVANQKKISDLIRQIERVMSY